MNERQKTPQRDHNASLLNQAGVNSTSQHHGTSEASSHLSSLTRAVVSPLIAKDLSKATSVEVDDMLRFFVAQIVLDKTKPVKAMVPEMDVYLEQIREVVKPFVETQSTSGETKWGSPQYLHAQLKEFQHTKTETEGYKPWVNFTNAALRLLKTEQVAGLRKRNEEDDIIMQRTDPKHVKYNHNDKVAMRKPDIAFLKLERAQALNDTMDNWDIIARTRAAKPPPREEQNNQEYTDQEPDDAGLPYFDWSDILFFSEHKFARRSPKSLSFEDLLVLEKLRAPVPPSPLVPSHSRKRSADRGPGSDSSAGRRKSQKSRADGTASSGFKNSQYISISHVIAEDAAFVPTAEPIADHEKDFVVQAGEYGLGRLNSWFGMTHSLGCLVLGSRLYICWFDREGLIGSSAIDVSKDLEEYLVLIFILQRFKDDEWGRLAVLNDPTIHIMDKTLKVDTKVVLHKPWGITGRNTTVIGCSQQPPIPLQRNSPSIPASDVSPMDGMPSVDHPPKQGDVTSTQDNEAPIYDQNHPTSRVAAEDPTPGPSSADESRMKEQTKKDEMKKNPFVVKFSWVEKTRIQEHEVYHKIKDVAKKDSNVEGHVPDLVAHHAFEDTSTSVIRDALGAPTPRSRLLVAVVFKRLDGTIQDLSGADYWKVYWENFLCHHGLWMGGVHHRDISDGNLMYKRDNDTGEVIGVLPDFDLSSLEGETSSNTERTGTIPFMALSLLSEDALAGKVKHDYGHEAEAFFWVGVYDTACYDNGNTIHHAVPAQWNSLGANAMREKKRDYLSSIDKHIATPSQEDVWRGLRPLQAPLNERQIFGRPTELDPITLILLQRRGTLPEPSDASVLEPDAVRDDFLEVRRLAEELIPSLLNKTSPSSS